MVDILTKAIKPTVLRDAVQKQMALLRNKPLKTNVFHGGGAQPDAPKPKTGDKPRAKLGCLKCGSAKHRVVDCPDVKPGEAKRLLEAQVKKWKNAKASVESLGDTFKCQPTQRGAVLEGAVPISNVLLDSGADVNVVSKGAMDALVSANVAVDVSVVNKPRRI
jgi:hypothetical protein